SSTVRLSRFEISETEYSGRLLRSVVGAEVSVIGPMMLVAMQRSPGERESHHGDTENKRFFSAALRPIPNLRVVRASIVDKPAELARDMPVTIRMASRKTTSGTSAELIPSR